MLMTLPWESYRVTTREDEKRGKKKEKKMRFWRVERRRRQRGSTRMFCCASFGQSSHEGKPGLKSLPFFPFREPADICLLAIASIETDGENWLYSIPKHQSNLQSLWIDRCGWLAPNDFRNKSPRTRNFQFIVRLKPRDRRSLSRQDLKTRFIRKRFCQRRKEKKNFFFFCYPVYSCGFSSANKERL